MLFFFRKWRLHNDNVRTSSCWLNLRLRPTYVLISFSIVNSLLLMPRSRRTTPCVGPHGAAANVAWWHWASNTDLNVPTRSMPSLCLHSLPSPGWRSNVNVGRGRRKSLRIGFSRKHAQHVSTWGCIVAEKAEINLSGRLASPTHPQLLIPIDWYFPFGSCVSILTLASRCRDHRAILWI